MNGIKDIRFPSLMRTTPVPSESKPEPKLILDPDYIDGPVAPQTPLDLLETLTGEDIAREFAEKQKSADEGICRDALVYLEFGMTPRVVIELIGIRRGDEHGVTKQKIEQAVSTAVDLLEKQKEKSK